MSRSFFFESINLYAGYLFFVYPIKKNKIIDFNPLKISVLIEWINGIEINIKINYV